jgi:hypothetical protein
MVRKSGNVRNVQRSMLCSPTGRRIRKLAGPVNTVAIAVPSFQGKSIYLFTCTAAISEILVQVQL